MRSPWDARSLLFLQMIQFFFFVRPTALTSFVEHLKLEADIGYLEFAPNLLPPQKQIRQDRSAQAQHGIVAKSHRGRPAPDPIETEPHAQSTTQSPMHSKKHVRRQKEHCAPRTPRRGSTCR